MFVSPATDGQWEAGGKQSEEPAAGEQVGVDCLGLEVDVQVGDVLLYEGVQLVHTQTCQCHVNTVHVIMMLPSSAMLGLNISLIL